MKDDYFKKNDIVHVDYKDIEVLKKFTNSHGRILGKNRTGLSSKNQRKVENAIKRARFMGLLPYINR